MSDFQREEAQHRKRDEHIARELGISIESLHEHPYEIDVVHHGIFWRIKWSDQAPPGVETEWSDIHPLHDPN